MDERMIDIETEPKYRATYLGRFGDFGLGNPDGIPSELEDLSDQEIEAYANELLKKLKEPTKLNKLACVDGRETIENADGSPADLLLQRVGGTSANLSTALNADASVIDTFSPTDTLGRKINVVNAFVERATGFGPSAHLRGCGGAKNEIIHQWSINQKPQIMDTTKALMGIPQINSYIGTSYDDDLGKRVVENAGDTAIMLSGSGWDGNKFVEGVVETNPGNVEDLKYDPDEKHHGHREKAFAIILGNQVLDENDVFAWNVKASMMIAQAYAGQRGKEGYTQAFIAETAKHLAVGDDLPRPGTPVFLLEAY
ncbi:MAG: hypothetical protein V4611_03645 [Patescibacteria group bacterium]